MNLDFPLNLILMIHLKIQEKIKDQETNRIEIGQNQENPEIDLDLVQEEDQADDVDR